MESEWIAPLLSEEKTQTDGLSTGYNLIVTMNWAENKSTTQKVFLQSLIKFSIRVPTFAASEYIEVLAVTNNAYQLVPNYG